MTCKDCLCYEACNSHSKLILEFDLSLKEMKFYEKVEYKCKHFKDKSKIIELYCNIGDTIYYVDYEHMFFMLMPLFLKVDVKESIKETKDQTEENEETGD